MSIYAEKYGFVYIWMDKKYPRFYIGSHWGTETDGYICSSNWMRIAYKRRPTDFKRRIIKRIYTNRIDLLAEEDRYLSMIKQEEMVKHGKDKNKTRYYNLHSSVKVPWHATENGIKTIGEKISKAKKGKKTGPRDPSVGEKISKAKKEKFAEREKRLGYKFHPEHRKKQKEVKRGLLTEEHKNKIKESLKRQWDNGTRKRAEPNQIETMSLKEQSELSSKRLKSKWSDPIWKEKQIQRLKDGAKKRPPRSEESKIKARNAQLGKPKIRKKVSIIGIKK